MENNTDGKKISLFQEIDARYFDVTTDLPKDYADLMNLKLKEMKD